MRISTGSSLYCQQNDARRADARPKVVAQTQPTPRHWKLFALYRAHTQKQPSMEPDQFLTHWQITYEELAELCSVSRNTVAHWFVKEGSRHKRYPTEGDKRRLAEVHAIWSFYQNEPQHVRKAWEKVKQQLDKKRGEHDQRTT